LSDFRKQSTDQSWKTKVQEEYHEIKKLCPLSYTGIRFHETGIEAITPQISIDFGDELYEIGRFSVEINLQEEKILFRNLDHAIDGFPHPHINNNGEPCFGNLEDNMDQLLAQHDCYALLVVIKEFLQTYNDDNPFIKIKRWSPDYDPDEEANQRYEDCWSNVGLQDCVACDDNDCPYYDDAESRCSEDHDMHDCVICRITQCGHHGRALMDCHDNRADDPIQCISCRSRDCCYAKDYDACFEKHDGELCKDCDIDCTARLKPEEAAQNQ
jgi:hypothetical protein